MGKRQRYCGNKTGQNLRVTGDQVEVIFHSDGEIERRGYLLNFTLVSLPSVSSVPTERNSGQPTQDTAIFNERMSYILSGIAFILLLVLCFILGFWCYRRSHHKQIKRLFTVVVSNYDET
ncbi:uncharacterized protein LOC110064416 [Orbicella faveolata]|uniref:uncharacterized protein LOC110064416 n=1 Tax=Orbicella faveolata TaxID=48498 RepID=UPI0009E2FE30|nr:uncharacterized protein LOC110064416 [Orbicella faveolata]